MYINISYVKFFYFSNPLKSINSSSLSPLQTPFIQKSSENLNSNFTSIEMESNWNFLEELQEIESDFAMLILNQPILCEPSLIKSLWNKAVLRALVDGGSNRWLDFIEKYQINDLKLPDFFSGDLDSIKPETQAHFEELNVKMISTPDQNETDFTKALRCIGTLMKEEMLNVKRVFVICENSGRFDQVIGNINTLHCSNKVLSNIPVIIFSSQSVTWVLQPGKHSISVSSEFVQGQFSCGLIPFSGPTLVTSSGLKWDLDNHLMEIGGLVSTSNTYSKKIIKVSCNRNLVWTTQYCKIDQ